MTAPRPRLRLPRARRLRRRRDFERVYRLGSRARGDVCTLAVVENDLPQSRIGLSIGRRVWRLAVRRNRVRRLFREAFRLSYDELPAGVDLVVIGSVPAVDPTLEEVRRELVRLAAKAWRRRQAKREAGGR